MRVVVVRLLVGLIGILAVPNLLAPTALAAPVVPTVGYAYDGPDRLLAQTLDSIPWLDDDGAVGLRASGAPTGLRSEVARGQISTTPHRFVATETGLVKRTGTVEVLGKAKQTELSYADELAGRGYDVTVRGTSAQGGDFIVNGVQWELKTLNSGSQGAVINNVQRGLQQSNRVIIDGRAAGLSHGDALKALERLKGSGSLNNATEIVIETRSGRIGWP
jgi:hypothetical protein